MMPLLASKRTPRRLRSGEACCPWCSFFYHFSRSRSARASPAAQQCSFNAPNAPNWSPMVPRSCRIFCFCWSAKNGTRLSEKPDPPPPPPPSFAWNSLVSKKTVSGMCSGKVPEGGRQGSERQPTSFTITFFLGRPVYFFSYCFAKVIQKRTSFTESGDSVAAEREA